MADDTMGSGERTEAALAAFSGDDGQQQQQQDDGQQRQAGGEQQDGQQQQQDDSQQSQQQAGQLTDEQLQADPRFQELSTLKDSVVNALSEFPGLIDDKGQPNLQEAGLQLKDATVLYDIMQGKGTPSALLDLMGKNAAWSDQQKQVVANDLIQWLTANKYLKDGQAAAGAPKAGQPGFKDPLQDRLDKIENDNKTRQQAAEQQKVQAHQQDVFENKFMPSITKLCEQKGLPKEDAQMYIDGIAKMVNGNKAIIGRIEKGNFVDVQKFFTQLYNTEVQRLQRWTKAQTAAADKKNKNPRIPAGGATPASGGSANKAVNVRDRDSRIAAASDLL